MLETVEPREGEKYGVVSSTTPLHFRSKWVVIIISASVFQS
jgi:hypothetical protein